MEDSQSVLKFMMQARGMVLPSFLDNLTALRIFYPHLLKLFAIVVTLVDPASSISREI
jgi:hypothetical protein